MDEEIEAKAKQCLIIIFIEGVIYELSYDALINSVQEMVKDKIRQAPEDDQIELDV